MKWKNLALETTTFFITASIYGWKPLFKNDEACRILLNDLDFYRNKYSCRIFAYVIMPEHYHIVIDLNNPDDLHHWLHDMQSHSAKQLKQWLNESNLYINEEPSEIWKEQARAVGIISERVLKTKINYIHKNPVKRGLVTLPEDWLWSSWRNYYLQDDSIFRIDGFESISSA